MHVKHINANDAVKDITLKVNITGLNVFRARLWIGSKLIKAGAFIVGCDIKIDGDNNDGD